MTHEKFKLLYDQYPAFFAGVHEPITQNLMPFGCDCEDGWYHLIESFCRLAKDELAQQKTPCSLKFIQIKEKFGGLRLYYDLSLACEPQRQREIEASIAALARFAEDLSYQTCEATGLPGHLYQTGWHKTLCQAEAEKRGYLKNPPPSATE